MHAVVSTTHLIHTPHDRPRAACHVSALPIVHAAHVAGEVRHAPAAEPAAGAGAAAHGTGEQQREDHVEEDEAEDEDGDRAEVNAGNGAGHGVQPAGPQQAA